MHYFKTEVALHRVPGTFLEPGNDLKEAGEQGRFMLSQIKILRT
jgi:hypothetical protein